MVCEYRGRVGFVTVTSEGWPDRKPSRVVVHRLAEAIKALQYYANFDNNDPVSSAVAKEALKNIKEQDNE
jgi:hypothetical protein